MPEGVSPTGGGTDVPCPSTASIAPSFSCSAHLLCVVSTYQGLEARLSCSRYGPVGPDLFIEVSHRLGTSRRAAVRRQPHQGGALQRIGLPRGPIGSHPEMGAPMSSLELKNLRNS